MIFLDKNENTIAQPAVSAPAWPLERYSFEHNERLHAALAEHFNALVAAGELAVWDAAGATGGAEIGDAAGAGGGEVSAANDGAAKSSDGFLCAAPNALSAGDFILGAGSSDVMVMAFCALRRRAELEGKKLVIFAQWPTFEVVLDLARAQGIEVAYTEDLLADFAAATAPKIAAESDFSREKFIRLHYFCNPNNPTGLAAPAGRLEQLAKAVAAGDWAILDEAYAEFSCEHLSLPLKSPRVLHLRTFSKAFALAAARIGYGIADADFMGLLAPFYNPDRINSFALFAACEALADGEFLPRLRRELAAQKQRITAWLAAHGIAHLPGAGNFIFHALTPAGAAASNAQIKIAYQSAAPSAYQAHMHAHSIAVARSSAALAQFGRISVGNEAETTALLAAWEGAHDAGLI